MAEEDEGNNASLDPCSSGCSIVDWLFDDTTGEFPGDKSDLNDPWHKAVGDWGLGGGSVEGKGIFREVSDNKWIVFYSFFHFMTLLFIIVVICDPVELFSCW